MIKTPPTPYGFYQGSTVFAHELRNAHGLVARFIDFGARLTEMHVPGRHGQMADIVLGFDELESYVTTDTYFGASCGRYGNRIKGGRFRLDGEWVTLSRNEGPNQLHGGVLGFDKKIWHAAPDAGGQSITFSLLSPDGDEGYPGALQASASYALTDDNRLLVAFTATVDRASIVNLISHSYWNLAGHNAGTVLEQFLDAEADFYTPVDAAELATGEIRSVVGTAFDFRSAKKLGRDIAGLAHGYDHNLVLRRPGPGLQPVATLWDQGSGRGFVLKSNQPGVQLYTGGHLHAGIIGKGGAVYKAFSGVALETQNFPGAPNVPHFPSPRLNPGEVYQHFMEYRFFVQ
jgi:aldose 1-epimerase